MTSLKCLFHLNPTVHCLIQMEIFREQETDSEKHWVEPNFTPLVSQPLLVVQQYNKTVK